MKEGQRGLDKCEEKDEKSHVFSNWAEQPRKRLYKEVAAELTFVASLPCSHTHPECFINYASFINH